MRRVAGLKASGYKPRFEGLVELLEDARREFLGLKGEYSESQLEEALILHLEHFLLELGDDFGFVGRQKRLRVGGPRYVVDLPFFHRRLRCLFSLI